MLSKNVCGSRVLGEMGFTIGTITLYMGSKSAICPSNNLLYHKCSKHIDIKCHLLENIMVAIYHNNRKNHYMGVLDIQYLEKYE